LLTEPAWNIESGVSGVPSDDAAPLASALIPAGLVKATEIPATTGV